MFRLNFSKNNYDTFKYNERYFRPSKFPSINVRYFDYNFYDKYSNEDYNKINLPDNLFTSPVDTIINYFSILREAESVTNGGCGSIGLAKSPYPISYNFFTSKFQDNINYKKYLSFFKNIGHINLVKLHIVPSKLNNSIISKHFIEIETIENTVGTNISFAYYYGFIYTKKENNKHKIATIELNPEDFLCAAYHGWAHNAEMYVDLTYGDWCHLIKKRHPTRQISYIKNIYITGTDGCEYKFMFFELTNGTDIEVAQFVLDKTTKQWKLIEIDVHKCH